jgi:DNA polymerase-3 subunit gamma/tau
MVYYRKYRPQTIAELDSPTIRESLYRVLGKSDVPHAFLFVGPKGLGKTSAARIVAKVVNCEKKNKELGIKNKGKDKKEQNHNSSSIEPCNECDQCISITNGSNLDVLEIDAASNRGIDEIRELRERIRLAPVRATKKVYIIDEVHMLTTEAFNALLKTLEEPPSHVLFILCTTESQKVPGTIASRCFSLQFRLADTDELLTSFKRILDRENISYEDDALFYVATLSEGSFRDGSKILEECVSLLGGKEKLTKELVEKKYQVVSSKLQAGEFIAALSRKDQKEGLRIISELTSQGVDAKFFIEQLLNDLHVMLLQKAGIDQSSKFTIRNPEIKMEDIKKITQLLMLAHQQSKHSVLPQLPLELVVIEWSGSENETHSSQGSSLRSSGQAVQAKETEETKVEDSGSIKTKQEESQSQSFLAQTSEAKENWQDFIEKVKQNDHSAAGLLRSCFLKEATGDTLIIETSFSFHRDKLKEKLDTIETTWKELTGKAVKAQIVLKE